LQQRTAHENQEDIERKKIMLPYLGVRYQVRYHQCNLVCPYCIVSWNKQDNLFDPATFRAILSQIQKLPYRISLRIGVGGEFFTSRDLMEGVAEICNSDSNIFNVSFSTNLVADWEKVIQPFLKSTNTAKLGLGCTLHDMVIKDVDAFFMKAEKIKAAGAEIYIGLVAIPGRFHSIAEYKKRCQSLDIPLILNGLAGNLVGVEGADPTLMYPRDYTLAELAELKELWDTPHSYQLLLEACQTKGMVCSAGRNYIYINHEGYVYPCQGISKPMGNIMTDTIVFQNEDTVCPQPVCWCGNENQALRIVDQYYDRSRTLRIFYPKKDIPVEQLYEGYNGSIYNRVK
jgi:pyruvate-formate lyase-activating enzyme